MEGIGDWCAEAAPLWGACQSWRSDARYLLLDEVQHAKEWSGWIKRIADRRDPYVFLATGSSATALRHGGQDAGLGRWREMVLYPWSFREHIHYRYRSSGLPEVLKKMDELSHEIEHFSTLAPGNCDRSPDDNLVPFIPPIALIGPGPEEEQLNNDLIDHIVRGGFPEVLDEDDWREAQRHLRQDILDRALGRDIADVERVDSRSLERLFLRVCKDPGGLWNATEVGLDLGLSRPTVSRYLQLLERAFLLFSLPSSPVL